MWNDPIQLLGLGWACFLIAAGPLNAFFARRHDPGPEANPNRIRYYESAARGLSIIAIITLAVDVVDNRLGLQATWRQMDPVIILAWTLLTSILCLVVSITFLIVRRRLRMPFPDSIARNMPQTRRELSIGLGLSAIAGVTEEYMYRGFCLLLLMSVTGSWWISFLLVTVSFGIGHGYQDVAGVFRATIAGGILAVPVLATGLLVPSMIAHTVIDFFAFGLGYTSILKRWGLIPSIGSGPTESQ